MECAHWSPDGRQIVSCGTPSGDGTTILTVDTGATRLLPFLPGLFSPCYVWSPDGRRLACETSSDSDPTQNGIRTVSVRTWSRVHRVTTNPGGDDIPGSYSPRGGRLVFLRQNGDGETLGLFVVRLDGTGLRKINPATTDPASPGDWSPRGDRIVFSGRAQEGHRQVMWTVRPDGSELTRIHVRGIHCGGSLDDPASIGCSSPVWSPDGRRIAFRLNANGRTRLLASGADGEHVHTVVSNIGVDPGEPDWGTHPLTHEPSTTTPVAGRWRQTHTCRQLVAALAAEHLEALAPGVVGDYFPDETPQQLAAKGSHLCRGARPQAHFHFFTPGGVFGSLDQAGSPVDDGTYTITGAHTLSIGDATFTYRVRRSSLVLRPVISAEDRQAALANPLDFSTAGWQVSVAYGGRPWHRVPCGAWC
jgi:Tol biopolymer transport system component